MSDFIIMESEACYQARMKKPSPAAMAAINKAQSKPAQSHLVPGDDFWTEIVFQIIKDNGIGPIRITSVVNE